MSNRRKDQRVYDDVERAQALELAAEVGAAQAGAELGIPPATIRSWMHREGRSRPPAGVDVTDWAAQRREGARHAWEAAQDALDEVKRWLAEGHPSRAQSAATTAGIMLDKSAILVRGAEEAEANAARISHEQGVLVAAAVEAVIADLGLPRSVRPLLRHYLVQAEEGTVVAGSAPGVRAVREELVAGLSDEVLREEARRRGVAQAALPSGRPEPAAHGNDSAVPSEVGRDRPAVRRPDPLRGGPGVSGVRRPS